MARCDREKRNAYMRDYRKRKTSASGERAL